MNAIELQDLTKEYKNFTLDHLNLTLPSGCIMGLIGENGAGKSTTIKLILHMIHKNQGKISVMGQDEEHLHKEDIGVVMDEVGFPECLTAEQVNKIMGDIYKNWQPQVYEDFLNKLSIPRNKTFKEFSRGMKMKLGIAVALSHQAKLLILDEATSGLDPVVRDEVLDVFSEFTRDESHAILLSSHIVSDLEKICDYIAFLHKGKLLLCEEKDVLCETYGVIHGSKEDFQTISKEAILGRRDTHYGSEAIVRRDAIPVTMNVSPVSIEDLFIFMVKEER